MKDIRTIIVEDETGAAANLQLLLADIAPEIEVLTVLSSVEQTIEWLTQNPHPALAFFDIQLEDGLSFEIFRKTSVDFPVIFTTAFNQYAIEAFKVNSIDYLLKPIKEEDLLFSLQKYHKLSKEIINPDVINKIVNAIPRHDHSPTFLIHYKDRLLPIPEKEFAFFYIDNGLVHGCTHKHQTYPIDQSMEDLEVKLTSTQFFKANRQYIVNRSAIKEIEFYFNSRLLLKLSPPANDTVLVSKARVPIFKEWMKG